uniref:Small nuclear ribonucleoprotein Sm D3 n=1 Tax=Scophthalmus maximus TaxID=52904 RepID=A0A8D3DC64_SCOMX
MSIGVPIKVLHEAEGHIVTCETNTGEVYRGKLIEAEDNMNCQMSNITVTYRDGRVAQLEQVYIRGSKIRFLILPDMLKNAPMLKSMKNKNQGSGAGRGKAAILKAQGEWDDFLFLDISKDAEISFPFLASLHSLAVIHNFCSITTIWHYRIQSERH